MHDLILVAQVLLALVFAVAGISKLANPAGSRTAMTDFGVPHSIAPLAAVLLPLAELAVAAALVSAGWTWYGAAGALALLLIFIAGIGYNLARGRHPGLPLLRPAAVEAGRRLHPDPQCRARGTRRRRAVGRPRCH